MQKWFKKRFVPSIPLLIIMLPALVYLFIFDYIPMYGVQIAFKNYTPVNGIWGSEWVGFSNFTSFFSSPQFSKLVFNTVSINLYFLATFPIPILLALMLNYCVFGKFKKIVQMATYAPHFISVVVLVGMLNIFLSPYNGIINVIINKLGGKSINFLIIPEYFKSLFVWSGVWQGAGYSSVIYIGALASVSPEYHEAAIVDGATKIKRIINIDIPCIMPTIIILFIMQIGHIMSLGFQKMYLMQNGAVLNQAEIISTYVYKVGLLQGMFSYSTAIGLFNNIINISLLMLANFMAKKLTETSLF